MQLNEKKCVTGEGHEYERVILRPLVLGLRVFPVKSSTMLAPALLSWGSKQVASIQRDFPGGVQSSGYRVVLLK